MTDEQGAGERQAFEAQMQAALAEGLDAEEMLAEVAELVRQAGREGLDQLRAAGLPTAGSA